MGNYFKKVIGVVATLILSLSFNVEAYSTNNVVDMLDYLTYEQTTSIQESIDQVKSKHKLDLVVVITDDVEGKTSMAYADDYYDYNGYGLDNKHSGVLLLINMEDREAWISTTGKAIGILTDARIDKILDDVTACLANEDYYGASQYFVKDVNNYAKGNIENPFVRKIVNSFTSLFTYIFSAILTVMIAGKNFMLDVYERKTIKKDTYLMKHSFKLTSQKDEYVRSHTSKSIRQTSSSSSGRGSSTHISSSGRSHGGGGRRF